MARGERQACAERAHRRAACAQNKERGREERKVHELEHFAFFATALLFWAHLLGDGPFRARLSLPARAAYAIGAMLVGWGLAVVIATAETPLYSHYADLATRPLGISALADQQLAAGIMWVPASVPWVIVAIVCVYGWLDSGARSHRWVRQLTGRSFHDEGGKARP